MTKIGRRGESRLRVRLPARLISLGATDNVILNDLSVNGARVSINKRLSRGERVILQWGKFEAFGQVGWVSSTHCGLVLIDPLPPSVLTRTRELSDDFAHQRSDMIERQAAQAFVRGVIRL